MIFLYNTLLTDSNYLGTGEHIQDLEIFKPQTFINKMLGQGDLSGLFEKLQDSQVDKESLIKNITQGKFTVRDMKGQLEMISGMGPMSKIMGMIPGMPAELANSNLDEQGGSKLKNFTCAMDSMTDKELDSDGMIFRKEPSRIYRVSLGSGVSIYEIQELLVQHETVTIHVNVDDQNGKGNGRSKWTLE
jgi:signal recognition particle subunit SRP54